MLVLRNCSTESFRSLVAKAFASKRPSNRLGSILFSSSVIQVSWLITSTLDESRSSIAQIVHRRLPPEPPRLSPSHTSITIAQNGGKNDSTKQIVAKTPANRLGLAFDPRDNFVHQGKEIFQRDLSGPLARVCRVGTDRARDHPCRYA